MHDVDFDLSDSMRALIRNGINIDDPLRRRGHQDGAPLYGHGPNRLGRRQQWGRAPSPYARQVRSESFRPTSGRAHRSSPTMSAGATDGSYLRNAGIPTYGHSGLAGDVDDVRVHGKDERVLVKSFFDGQEYLYRLVKMLSGG